MEFIINKKIIVDVLSEFVVILKENPIRPILNGIKITTEGENLKFLGTNLEIDLIKTVPAEIIQHGGVVIKPNLILEYIKLMDQEEIKFKLQESTLYIHQAEFSVLNLESYPVVPVFESTEITSLNGKELKEIFDKVKFVASQNNDNLAINVIRLQFKKDFSEFVATDSHRLIYLKKNIASKEETSFSLPLDGVNSLSKLLKDEEDITINFSNGQAIFLWNNTYFSTKTIELSFPAFENIINDNSFSKHMEFNNSEIKSSLKKILAISKTSVDLKFGANFKFGSKKVQVQVNSGKAKLTEKFNVIMEGTELTTSLNTKYLLDFISQIDNNVILEGIDSNSKFKITELGDNSYQYIMMPLSMRS